MIVGVASTESSLFAKSTKSDKEKETLTVISSPIWNEERIFCSLKIIFESCLYVTNLYNRLVAGYDLNEGFKLRISALDLWNLLPFRSILWLKWIFGLYLSLNYTALNCHNILHKFRVILYYLLLVFIVVIIVRNYYQVVIFL